MPQDEWVTYRAGQVDCTSVQQGSCWKGLFEVSHAGKCSAWLEEPGVLRKRKEPSEAIASKLRGKEGLPRFLVRGVLRRGQL